MCMYVCLDTYMYVCCHISGTCTIVATVFIMLMYRQHSEQILPSLFSGPRQGSNGTAAGNE